MLKVSLITIFDNPNFGTYLQALALSKVIEKQGAKVEIINYWREFNIYHKRLNPFCPGFIARIVRLIKNLGIIAVRNRQHRYIRKKVALTRQYTSYHQLEKNPPQADIYLTGSDQVWNTKHNHGIDKAFYLGFAPAGKRKCAYGASIGMQEIDPLYKEETIRLLSQYDFISVRETSSVDLLYRIGISPVKMVLDPTLLFDRSDWGKYIKQELKPQMSYLLVYSVESAAQREVIADIAEKVAKKKNLQKICISYGGKGSHVPRCDKYYYYSTLERFLTLFYYADFTVVSSFHGTAFSINMNRPFITVAPERFSSRIDSLLQLTGLENRKVSRIEDFHASLLVFPDYAEINQKLNLERQHSIQLVKKNILTE